MSNLSARQKNILTIIVVIILSIVLVTINLLEKYNDLKIEQEKSTETVLVKDDSRYFTVVNCVRKFLDYVTNGTKDEILLLLSQEYKDSYKINSSNYKNFLPKLSKDYLNDYVGEEMYQHRVSKNVVEYYVKGNIQQSQLDEPSKYVEYNVTVILYEDNLTFSIKPGIGDLKI